MVTCCGIPYQTLKNKKQLKKQITRTCSGAAGLLPCTSSSTFCYCILSSFLSISYWKVITGIVVPAIMIIFIATFNIFQVRRPDSLPLRPTNMTGWPHHQNDFVVQGNTNISATIIILLSSQLYYFQLQPILQCVC